MASRLRLFIFTSLLVFSFTLFTTVSIWLRMFYEVVESGRQARELVLDALVIEFVDVKAVETSNGSLVYIEYRIANIGDNSVRLVKISIDNKYSRDLDFIEIKPGRIYVDSVILENTSIKPGSQHEFIVYFEGEKGLKWISTTVEVR